MEPNTATPRVPPSSRVVLLTPAAAPRCSSATEPMTASVVGAVMEERPRARSTMATTIGPKYAVLASELKAATTSPPAMRSSPMVTTRRVPTLSATTAASGVNTAATTANGSVCSAGRQRRVPLDELEVLRDEEDEPEEAEEGDRDGDRSPGEAGDPEDPHVEQRALGAQLEQVKAVSRTAAAAKQASVPTEAQPHCGPSMMASTSIVTPAGRQHHAPNVEAVLRRPWGAGNQQPPGDQGDDHDRHVDEEDGSVPEVLEERPADDRAERHRDARRRPPDARAPSAARMDPGRCSSRWPGWPGR